MSGAAKGQRHPALRAAAVSLGGIQDQAGFSDAEAKRWLLDAIAEPASRRKDEDTIEWGLANGRSRPIELRAPKRIVAPTHQSTLGNLLFADAQAR